MDCEMISGLIATVLVASLLSAEQCLGADPVQDPTLAPDVLIEDLEGSSSWDDGARLNQFTYIDELAASAEVWQDGRKFHWLHRECDFQSPCGFGAFPIDSKTGEWHLQSNTTWRVYKENFIDESGTNRTTGLGYRSYGAAESVLFSDPVPCIQNKFGSVRLKVRLFGDLLFRICFVSMKTGKRTCGTTVQPRKYGYSTYNMDQPMPEDDGINGLLFIRLEFVAKDSSFILIEKISYLGLGCFEESPPRPTQALKFATFKENADYISMQNVIAVLLDNEASFQLFIQDMYTYKTPGAYVTHACKALSCYKTKDLCLYNGLHGAVEFILSKKDDKLEARATFRNYKVEFAMFASEEFFDRQRTDPHFHNHDLQWRFLINDFGTKEANMTVCFLYRTFTVTEIAEQCSEPRRFGEINGFTNYFVQIPKNAVELRLVVWRKPGPFKLERERRIIDDISIRGVDVLGCTEKNKGERG